MTAAGGLMNALRRGMVLVQAVILLRSLVFLRANAGVYDPAWLEWGSFGVLVAISTVVGFLTLRGRSLVGYRAGLTFLTLAASVTATAAVPAGSLVTSAHWNWYIIGWIVVATNLGGRFNLIAQVLCLHLVVVVGQVLLAGPVDRHAVAELIIRGFLFTSVQLTFAAAGQLITNAARTAERIREGEARVLTRQRIADEVLRDQHERHQSIAATTVPLLEGLSSGALSPADPAVRRACMVEATRLRRLMAESDQNQNPLNHELRACVDVAERAGVQVEVAFRGAGPSPGLAARRRLTEPLIAVLAEAREYARVTVVGTSRDVVVSVIAPVPEERELDMNDVADVPDDGSAAGVEVTVVSSPGQIWVTARWEAA